MTARRNVFLRYRLIASPNKLCFLSRRFLWIDVTPAWEKFLLGGGISMCLSAVLCEFVKDWVKCWWVRHVFCFVLIVSSCESRPGKRMPLPSFLSPYPAACIGAFSFFSANTRLLSNSRISLVVDTNLQDHFWYWSSVCCYYCQGRGSVGVIRGKERRVERRDACLVWWREGQRSHRVFPNRSVN